MIHLLTLPVSVIMFSHYRLLHRSILLHHLLSFSFFLVDYFSLLLSFFPLSDPISSSLFSLGD